MYLFLRAVLYPFWWLVSLVELGLTGYRVHHTESTTGTYDPIIVALIVTSALTLLWVPSTLFFHVRKARDLRTGSGYRPLAYESIGNTVLWIMWLVCGAIVTNKFPNKVQVPPGKQGHVLRTIVAFSWLAFGAVSLIKIVTGMHYTALRGFTAEPARGPAEAKREEANA